MTLADLDEAMDRIVKHYDLCPTYSFYPDGKRAAVEMTAHEIAHWIALGHTRFMNKFDVSLQDQLARMSDRRANQQEALTCAIEVLGLRRLGMRIDVRRLADNASTMMRGISERSEYRRCMRARKMVRAALRTQEARQGATRFTEIVQRFQRKA